MNMVHASPHNPVERGNLSAAEWPEIFTPYADDDGTPIYDPGADVNPIDVDFTSGVDRGIGNLPSVYYASDGDNFFARFRLKGDPYDRKGGFLSSVWLVQIAAGGEHKATIGLNGKSPHEDYVYVANADGTKIHSIYRTAEAQQDGKTVVPGTRITAAENGHYFLDIQVPISEITEVVPEITASTDVQLFFGSSKAANLSVINKEWMKGSTVSFAELAEIKLNTQPLTISIDGGASKVYSNAPNNVMTGKISSGENVTVAINGGDSEAAQIDGSTWSYTLPAEIIDANGIYRAVATVTDSSLTATAEQDIMISQAFNTITINGGSESTTTSTTPTISGTYVSPYESANFRVRLYIDDFLVNNNVNKNEGVWIQEGVALADPADGKTYKVEVKLTNTPARYETFASATQELTYQSDVTVESISVAIELITPEGSSRPVISGTSEGAEQVEVRINGTTVEIATPEQSGAWSVPALERPLAVTGVGESHEITAIARNAQGNTAVFSADHAVTQTTITIDNGTSVTLNDNLPTIRGNTNAQDGSTVSVAIGTAWSGETTAQNGRWTIEVPDGSPLADDTYTVTATTINSATATQTLIIKTETTVAITTPADEATTTETKPTISGTAEAGATIDLIVAEGVVNFGDGGLDPDKIVIAESLTTEGSGNWNHTPIDDLDAGETYTIIATATDDYGNEAMDVSTFTISAGSDDAGLTSVHSQTDSNPGGGNGDTAGAAITWEINVAHSVEVIGRSHIAVAENATFNLYTNSNYTDDEVTGENTETLTVGSNTAYIKVTAEDGVTDKYYAVTINRAADASGFAVALAQEGNKTAGEEFNLSITNAKGADGNDLDGSINVTVTSNLEGDNPPTEVYSGAVTFTDGAATVPVTLTKADSHTLTVDVTGVTGDETVAVTVVAGAPDSATLTMDPSSISYADYNNDSDADSTVDSIVVKDASGNVISDGNEAGTYSVSAPAGAEEGTDYEFNTTTGTLTIKDGATKAAGTYTIIYTNDINNNATATATVTVEPSTNADLSGLALRNAANQAAITYSPNFAAGTTAYTATVGNNVTQVQVQPTVADINATIKVGKTGEEKTAVTSGNWSGNIALSVGHNVIEVEVTAQDGINTKTYTITITRASAPSAPAPAAPVEPQVEEITVNVVPKGDIGTVISRATIERTTETNGTIKDKVTYKPEQAQETVNQAQEAGHDGVSIIIPDENDEVAELQVTLPRETVKIIAEGKVDLEISSENARIIIPKESIERLADMKDDLFFRVVPIREEEQRRQVEEQARTEQLTLEISEGRRVDVVERPSTIETNMPSHPVTIVLPFRESNIPTQHTVREEYMKDLFVFIQHSDGDKAILKGKVTDYDGRGVYGLEFGIEKFSTFAIIHMASEFNSYTLPEQTKPAVINYINGTIHVEVASGTDLTNLIAQFELSTGAIATVDGKVQVSGETPNDFTKPLIYLVESADGSIKKWTVYVTKEPEKTVVGEEADFHPAYIRGYPDGTFGPERSITRAEMAAIVYRNLEDQTIQAGDHTYPDVDQGHWARQTIEVVSSWGIMGGYPEGDFRPEGNLTRAEMASLIVRWMNLQGERANNLTDVEGHWAQEMIEILAGAGIVGGYPDGSFQPNREITRAEAVAIINRVLSRGPLHGVETPSWPDVSSDHWAFCDIEEASRDHYYILLEDGLEMLQQ